MAGGLAGPEGADAAGGTAPASHRNTTSGDGGVATSVSLETGGGASGGGSTTGGPAQTMTDAGPNTGDAGTLSADGAAATGSGVHIDLSETSVSGFSSGAFFAVQFHVAFSSTLKGAAIFAGGPYDCAQDSANTAETTCLTRSPDVTTLVAATKKNYAEGSIDDPSNLATERVFLFGGADDSVVHPSVVASLNAYYASFMSSSSIEYVSDHPGTSHTMPTLDYGGDCDSVVSPYVGNCKYDGAGNALEQIYGTLNQPSSAPTGTMHSFSQTMFVPNAATEGLADTGYFYVPTSCASGETCKVHISFHGCEQNAALVDDAYYGHAGYNVWADTNHIIVLYPQATSSSGNDYECWDFWGYDGASYATQSGTQLAAVKKMLDWIAGGAGGAIGGGVDAGASMATATDAGESSMGFFDASGIGTGYVDAGGIGSGYFDAGSSCVTAPNTAQVAAGRAHAVGGYAYATGSDEFLGADNASTTSSLEESGNGIYTICL